MKTNKSIVFILAGALWGTCLLTGCGQQPNASDGGSTSMAETMTGTLLDEISPILDEEGADPFVTRYGDAYLYTKTTGNNVSIAVADSIDTLGAAELHCVYDPGSDLRDLWAPEIWRLDDCWYIYFAATVPGEEMHYMFVLSNPSEDPMEGEWTCQQLEGMDDKFAIDGTVMELQGKRYFLWSGWEGYENVRQDIYLAEMVSPVEVMNEKILISMPEYDWEQHGNPLINEGPEAVVRGETVNLIYSASGSWTDDYCLGLLTMPVDSDPKNPANWTKHDQPILVKDLDVYGPGHNCFTVSPDGTEDINVYHAARWMGAGWDRHIRYSYVTFDEKGVMQPMTVTSGEETLKIPAGSGAVTCYPAEAFTLSGDNILRGDEGKKYIKGFLSSSDQASILIESAEEKDVTLTVFVRANDLMGGVISGLAVKVNDEESSDELHCSENYQPLYFKGHLFMGANEITIRTDVGGSELEVLRMEIRE